MLKNQIVTLDVERVGINGEGVAHCEGKVVFIKNALPPEKINARIICVKSKYCYAIPAAENAVIGDFSSIRTTPACPLFNKCGGCDLQHVKYENQLEIKRQRVEDEFKKARIDCTVSDVFASDRQLRYRNKMSLPIREVNGELKIGLFAASSHRVISCDDCLLQPLWNKEIIKGLKNFIESHGLTGYDEIRKKGDIRHLVVREVAGKMIVTVVCTRQIDLSDFVLFISRNFENAAVYLNIKNGDDNVILGEKWIMLYGNNCPTVIDGLAVDIHPAGFFQVNDYIRDRIYEAVREIIAKGRPRLVIDAYSGAGIMTAMLAPYSEKIIGIEINEEASRSAEKLIQTNKIKNMRAVTGDVKDCLPEYIGSGDGVFTVLDPPRSGCDRGVIDTIIKARPEKIIYVSCNPATLVRDVSLLNEIYKVDTVRPYDMFPQCSDVENLTVLSLR